MNFNDFELDITGLVPVQNAVEPVSNKLRKLTDTYSEYAKLVFLFDVSGSMAGSVDGGYCGSSLEINGKPVTPVSRIDLVKRMAKQEIDARYKKYPQSQTTVIRFGSHAETIFDGGTKNDLDAAMDQLNAHSHLSGGTDIMSGLRKAMQVSRENPSPVGIHHFIVVTDGADGGTYAIDEWIPALKASGVVLDYIHIGRDSSGNENLRQATKKLGGAYVVVDSVKAFEEKFLEAVNRPLMIEAGQ